MLSVLIPVYNEEAILRDSALKVHEYLEREGIEHEILVTDNGSTDRTSEIGQGLEREFSWLRFFSLKERGPGLAFRHAVREAKSENLVCLDADLSSNLSFVSYSDNLLKHASMVIGSKTFGSQHRSGLRIFASQFYILCSQLLFDLSLSDYSIGCKAFRRAAILPCLDLIDPWTGYVFEIALYLRCKHEPIIQVSVDCDDKRHSHFNLLHEGLHRFRHLYICWKRTRDPKSWLFGGARSARSKANANGAGQKS